LRGNNFGINRNYSDGEQCRQIISPAINDSTIEINESVKAPVEVVKEDVNKTVVAHHSRHDAPAQADVNKKSYTSIMSYYVPSLPLLLHLMS
jgi:hypothetical protein